MNGCTFFGHRLCPDEIEPTLRSVLAELIEHHQVKLFYIGNQGSFDAKAYRVVCEFRKKYPFIQCYIVLAYLPLKNSTGPDTILPEGIEKVPRRYSIFWRNEWMLKRSDYVVTYVTHPSNGAAQFAKRAEKQGKYVINLAEKIL